MKFPIVLYHVYMYFNIAAFFIYLDDLFFKTNFTDLMVELILKKTLENIVTN